MLYPVFKDDVFVRFVEVDEVPAVNKPSVQIKPAEDKSAEVKSAEVKPAEVNPGEVKPAEVKPDEVKPAEVKPAVVKTAATVKQWLVKKPEKEEKACFDDKQPFANDSEHLTKQEMSKILRWIEMDMAAIETRQRNIKKLLKRLQKNAY